MARLRTIILVPLVAASLSAAVARVEPDRPALDPILAAPAHDFVPWDAAPADLAPERVPARAPAGRFEQYGVASWYGGWHHGRPTASGARFDMNKLTAAHRTLPLGTTVRVTNLANGRAVEVTINDRGPYVGGRVIDLSRRAASDLAMVEAGLATVRIEMLSAIADADALRGSRRAIN